MRGEEELRPGVREAPGWEARVSFPSLASSLAKCGLRGDRMTRPASPVASTPAHSPLCFWSFRATGLPILGCSPPSGLFSAPPGLSTQVSQGPGPCPLRHSPLQGLLLGLMGKTLKSVFLTQHKDRKPKAQLPHPRFQCSRVTWTLGPRGGSGCSELPYGR